MKKIILILCMCLLLTGCDNGGAEGIVNGVTNSMFITVETGWNYKVMYHKDTKVMYAVSYGTDNQGVFTLLVNADGTPMVYGESEVQE